MIKKLLYIILGVVIAVPTVGSALSVYYPIQGGTGTSTTPTSGQVLVGQSNGTYAPQSNLSLKGTIDNLVELISDPNFNDATKWNIGGNWTVSGGSLNHVGSATFSPVTEKNPAAAIVGQYYYITVKIDTNSTGDFIINYGGAQVLQLNSYTGTYTSVVQAVSTDGIEFDIYGGGGLAIDSVSVKQLFTATFGNLDVKNTFTIDHLDITSPQSTSPYAWNLIAGSGNDATGGAQSGNGGNFTISAGNAGNFVAGPGTAGVLTLRSGNGSNGGSATAGAANGGALNITAGNGAGDDPANGGDINLTPGTSAGGGVSGLVNVAAGLNITARANVNPLTVSTNLLKVLSTGNIGIGKATPTYKLDIGGTAATDGINTDVGLNFTRVENAESPTAELIADGGAGNLGIGIYRYAVTFTTALGETTGLNNVNITTDATHKQVLLSFATSTDARVTGRKIYRTPVGLAVNNAKLLATISNNATTTYVDNIADASLGTALGFSRPNTTNKNITIDGNTSMVIDNNLTVLGYKAGYAVTSASSQGGGDVLIGNSAGYSLTSGTSNHFIGSSAGFSNTTGAANVAIGRSSLYYNQTGISNVAIAGYSALNKTTGSNNIGIGYEAGTNNTSGTNNIFIGSDAGQYTQVGHNNTIVGYNAGLGVTLNSYSGNNIFGYQAGKGLTTGSYNVLVGYQSAMNLTSGSSNILIGDRISAQSTTTDGQLSVGNLIFGTGVNVTGTTISSGFVGISTSTPKTKLDVFGTTTVETGDLHIRDVNYGIIMPDTSTGSCYRMRITAGVLTPTLIATSTCW